MKCPNCGSENISQNASGKEYNEFDMPINNTVYTCSDCGFNVGRWANGKVMYNKPREKKNTKHCEYCFSNEDAGSGECEISLKSFIKDDVSLTIDKNILSVWVNGVNIARGSINYCPMCRRKLT